VNYGTVWRPIYGGRGKATRGMRRGWGYSVVIERGVGRVMEQGYYTI